MPAEYSYEVVRSTLHRPIFLPIRRMSDRLTQNSGSAAAVLAARSLPVGIWITSNYIRDRDLPLLDLLEVLRLVKLEMQMVRLRACENNNRPLGI